MEELLSVGLDVGTTTTQLVFSRLTLENQGNAFSVPKVVIRDREVIYRSPIYFTPLKSAAVIDAEALRALVAAEYEKAEVQREQVDTGAVIITGETARKENAREVLRELSGFAGDFVVSTAGPDLEAILAARGAGAQEASQQREGLLLHMDIGGGTSNLAVYRAGKLLSTGCLDVGGRVLRFDKAGRIDWLSPKIQKLFPALKPGQTVDEALLEPLLTLLTRALEAVAGLEAKTPEIQALTTHRLPCWTGNLRWVSFSGGVADAIWNPTEDWRKFGDIGVLLGRSLRKSRLFTELEPLRLRETIQATVIGAGTQTTELSGSTVYYRGIGFPLQNLPVLRLENEVPDPLSLREQAVRLGDEEGLRQFALSLPGFQSPGFRQLQNLAERLAQCWEALPGLIPIVLLERDMAKALGQALAVRLPGPLLVLDSLSAREGDYVDVGTPVAGGTAVPVVIKTLAFC